MCCWAIGNRVIGKASQVMLTPTICGHACRGRRTRAAGTTASVAAPITIRPNVTANGSNPSRASAIWRNDAPQMNPAASSSAQSRGANASPCVPSAVNPAARTAVDDGSCTPPGYEHDVAAVSDDSWSKRSPQLIDPCALVDDGVVAESVGRATGRPIRSTPARTALGPRATTQGRCPSGQREQTVNLPATPTEVRILPGPPRNARRRPRGAGPSGGHA
jgi:hypothetical protein